MSPLPWAPGIEFAPSIGDKRASPGTTSAAATAEPRETAGELASEEGLQVNHEIIPAAAQDAPGAAGTTSTRRPVRGAWLIRAAAMAYLVSTAIIDYLVFTAA